MSCPRCPHCKKKTAQPQQSARPDWRYDLRYLDRHERPIWGGPLQRGETMTDDPHLSYLIERGYAEQVGIEGFVITELGRKVLAEMRF